MRRGSAFLNFSVFNKAFLPPPGKMSASVKKKRGPSGGGRGGYPQAKGKKTK